MKPSAVIRHFGSQTEVARQLGMTPQAISLWKTRGRIPRRWHPYLSILMERRRRK